MLPHIILIFPIDVYPPTKNFVPTKFWEIFQLSPPIMPLQLFNDWRLQNYISHKSWIHVVIFHPKRVFFKCYLAVPQQALVHYREDSLIYAILITEFLQFGPVGHREPRNGVGSLSPTQPLVWVEPGTFRL